jgi:hypothetical protein
VSAHATSIFYIVIGAVALTAGVWPIRSIRGKASERNQDGKLPWPARVRELLATIALT